jgi:inward rectifier potassium channel
VNERPKPGEWPKGLNSAATLRSRKPKRAVVRGQDRSRWTDSYHTILTAPWWLFVLGLAVVFGLVNIVFALVYLADPGGISHARPGNFWDHFLFSAQTIGSIYSEMTPKSAYTNTVVVIEAFIGFVYLGLMTSLMFARLSRPSARVLFSKVAVIAPFDGVPTLQFRAANQRGNQILDAGINVTLAHQTTSSEGIVMRRFDELELVRSRTSLFALSWTVMHRIDEKSPLHGLAHEDMEDRQMEIIVLLRGTDDTLADVIYARHAYAPEDIVWNERFVDVLSVTPQGRRMVDLTRFHDTCPI